MDTARPGASLYLVLADAREASLTALERELELVRLRPGLYLIETEATRSRLYHTVKRGLPADAPLVVARLSGLPKAKGLEPGAQARIRARFG